MASVTFRDVSKSFPGGNPALRSVDLSVRDGELLVLVGPSGSGKTTLLRLLAGLDQPTSGEILVDGKPVLGVPACRRNLAMVFQGESLYPHLSVYQNLAFGLHETTRPGIFARLVRGVLSVFGGGHRSGGELEEKIRTAASCLGLESMLARRPVELSGGERQRVALGRAIVRNPAVFLLDEPFSGLDTLLARKMAGELSGIQRRLKTTTILVTHNLHPVFGLADRIAVLKQGELLQVDTPWNIWRRPASRYVAEMVGEPELNLINVDRVRVNENSPKSFLETAAGSVQLPTVIAVRLPEKLTLGFRSSDTRIFSDDEITGLGCGSAGRQDDQAVVLPAGVVQKVAFCAPSWLISVSTGPAENDGYGKITWQAMLFAESSCDGFGPTWLAPGVQVRTWVRAENCLWLDRETGNNLLKDA